MANMIISRVSDEPAYVLLTILIIIYVLNLKVLDYHPVLPITETELLQLSKEVTDDLRSVVLFSQFLYF